MIGDGVRVKVTVQFGMTVTITATVTDRPPCISYTPPPSYTPQSRSRPQLRIQLMVVVGLGSRVSGGCLFRSVVNDCSSGATCIRFRVRGRVRRDLRVRVRSLRRKVGLGRRLWPAVRLGLLPGELRTLLARLPPAPHWPCGWPRIPRSSSRWYSLLLLLLPQPR